MKWAKDITNTDVLSKLFNLSDKRYRERGNWSRQLKIHVKNGRPIEMADKPKNFNP